MQKSRRFRLLVCGAAVAALVLTLALPVVSQDSGLEFQRRSGQLGGRPNHFPESRPSSPPPHSSEDPDPESELDQIISLEEQCLAEVNRVRRSRGLGGLELDEDLLEVARAFSRRMAEERFFSHEDPEGRSVQDRVAEAGIRWRMIGENLAYSNGYYNPVAASMRGWMDSETHRRNLLDPGFTRTAIGAWIGRDGTIYFTEIFLRR